MERASPAKMYIGFVIRLPKLYTISYVRWVLSPALSGPEDAQRGEVVRGDVVRAESGEGRLVSGTGGGTRTKQKRTHLLSKCTAVGAL